MQSLTEPTDSDSGPHGGEGLTGEARQSLNFSPRHCAMCMTIGLCCQNGEELFK